MITHTCVSKAKGLHWVIFGCGCGVDGSSGGSGSSGGNGGGSIVLDKYS